MEYKKSNHYGKELLHEKIMGPNPLKLEEELLLHHDIPSGALVLDLGSGTGLTSVFLAKEYGFRVIAADLWSDPTENKRFFDSMGADVFPLHADATALPFAHETFDAIVCTDSYNYFGRDKAFLGEKLLPFLKKGKCLYIAIPGMKRDLHNTLPPELLLSWTPEQLDYLHDADYWRAIFACTSGITFTVQEMEGNEELWQDWLECDNEYARGDRKSIEAGGGKYLNFLSAVIRRDET